MDVVEAALAVVVLTAVAAIALMDVVLAAASSLSVLRLFWSIFVPALSGAKSMFPTVACQ